MGRPGFTLIEVMVTVVIIGVLAAIAVPAFTRTTRKTRGSETHAVFAELRQRQEEYHLANGTYSTLMTTLNDSLRPGQRGHAVVSGPRHPLAWNLFHKAFDRVRTWLP